MFCSISSIEAQSVAGLEGLDGSILLTVEADSGNAYICFQHSNGTTKLKVRVANEIDLNKVAAAANETNLWNTQRLANMYEFFLFI